MSDDEDVLQELRAALRAREGLSATALRARELIDKQHASSSYFLDPKHNPMQRRANEEEEEEEEEREGEDEAEQMHDGLRSHFPMSFGLQEKKGGNILEMHDTFKRGAGPSIGPPRPPGPPRQPMPPPSSNWTSAREGEGDRQREDEEEEGEDEGNLVGPPRPPPDGEGEGEGEGEDEDEDEGEDKGDGDPWLLPITHEVSLGGHNRAVTALDIDHTGSRIITGGLDYMVRMYDFNGMKRDMRAFREFEPTEGHPIRTLSWSPTGDQFLVVSGSSRAKVYDRDGQSRGEFVRGDMYIRDMKNTKGHVSGLCGGQWHPTDRFTAMTCSEDGTVRIWDTWNILQKTVIKPLIQKPVRTPVTTCRYNSDGRLIGAGLVDGSIQVWSVTGKFGTSAAVGQVAPPSAQMVEKQGWSYVSRPNQVVRNGHVEGEEITSLAFSRDGNTLVSRGMDATLKIWDLRKFNRPVFTFTDLPVSHSGAMCIFSPDEQLVLTGLATGKPQDETGAVVFFDRSKGELVRKLAIPGTVTALAWHPRLNQIFVGSGDRKSGATRVLYDTSYSERGVLIGAMRVPRQPDPLDFQAPLIVKEYDPERKRRRDDKDLDPRKLTKPNTGKLTGLVGRGAKEPKNQKTILTQHIMKTKGKLKSADATEDPREALLRQDGKKDVFSEYLTAAYKETQPIPIFHKEEEEEGEGEE